MRTANEVAAYCDHAFEASQRALLSGHIDNFRLFAQQHAGLAELYHHLRRGGSIH